MLLQCFRGEVLKKDPIRVHRTAIPSVIIEKTSSLLRYLPEGVLQRLLHLVCCLLSVGHKHGVPPFLTDQVVQVELN
jgi:hypothetical protein